MKYNDPVRNINNIQRFLGELSDDLYAHDYVNCCYACGRTDDLGIYMSGGSVVQYCGNCRKGTPVTADDEQEAQPAPAQSEEPHEEQTQEMQADTAQLFLTPDQDIFASDTAARDEPAADDTYTGDEPDDLMSVMAEAAAEINAEEIAGTVEDLLTDVKETNDEPEITDDREVVIEGGDGADLSSFIVSEEEVREEALRQEMIEEERRENEEYLRATEEKEPEDGALDSLMFSEPEKTEEEERNEQQPEDIGEVTFGNANTYIEKEESSGVLDNLMFDGSGDAAEESDEPEELAGEEAEDANIYGLMLGSEQEIAEEGETEVTELTAAGVGSGEDLTVKMQEDDDVGEDGTVEVTELYDDSNEGEDIEIQELDSDFNRPTETKGGEIKASETPLEADGSVPMVNPQSDFADTKPSSVRDRNAVRAFAYGSYENANTAEEPVRFDGRPKGFQTSDPRMGDEMGSVSRDYSRQQAAQFAPNAKKQPMSEQRVVSKGRRSGGKTVTYSGNTSYGDSNVVVGIIAALLFGVIGCAIWCGVGYVMQLMTTVDDEIKLIVTAVFGFLPTLFVFVGYRIGGDCLDKKGTIISIVMTVILDGVGAFAVYITGEMQRTSSELGYNLPFDKLMDNVVQSFSEIATGSTMLRQLGITVVAMIVALVIAIVVAKKKN